MLFEFTYFFNYVLIVIYIIFSLMISFILVLLSVFFRYLSLNRPDIELASAYECGFLPFDKARLKFDVKFFMVGILFVLFDLEVVFILPWSMYLSYFNLYQFFLMFIFLLFLVISFIYGNMARSFEFLKKNGQIQI